MSNGSKKPKGDLKNLKSLQDDNLKEELDMEFMVGPKPTIKPGEVIWKRRWRFACSTAATMFPNIKDHNTTIRQRCM